jgi:hypothetical protein
MRKFWVRPVEGYLVGKGDWVSSQGSEVLLDRVRKSGNVAGYDRIGRSMVRKRSSKAIQLGKQSGKAGLS